MGIYWSHLDTFIAQTPFCGARAMNRDRVVTKTKWETAL